MTTAINTLRTCRTAEHAKQCGKCRSTKPTQEFQKNSGMPDGLQKWCKVCRSQYGNEMTESRLAEECAVGTHVQTPTGALAVVTGYRRFRKGNRMWLVCRYVHASNKRADVVQILPELVVVVERKEAT